MISLSVWGRHQDSEYNSELYGTLLQKQGIDIEKVRLRVENHSALQSNQGPCISVRGQVSISASNIHKVLPSFDNTNHPSPT